VKPKVALRRFDEFVAALPRKIQDNDQLFEGSVLGWVRDIKSDDRSAFFEGLGTWLAYGQPSHRLALAALIGAAFGEPALIDSAVAMAIAPPPAGSRDKNSILRLALVDLATRYPDSRLLAYLEQVARGASAATTYQELNVAGRAGVALCFLRQHGDYEACVAPVLGSLRGRTTGPFEEVAAFASLLAGRGH
jgi:hypothetical protein